MPDSTASDPIPAPAANPFPGPQPYRTEDQARYFGREKLARALVRTVLARRVLTVFGPSGSGKSSLYHCRIIPKLQARRMRVTVIDSWPIAQRGGADLISEIRRELAQQLDIDIGQPLIDGAAAESAPRRVLDDAFLQSSRPIYMLFDQAEQLLDRAQPAQIELFVNTLARLTLTDQGPLHVMVSLREDHLGSWMAATSRYPELREHTFQVPRIRASEAVAAVVQASGLAKPPRKPWNEAVVKPLVHSMVAQSSAAGIDEDPEIEAAYVQIVCRALWDKQGPLEQQSVDPKDILEGYLNDTISSLGPELVPSVRRLLEEHLVVHPGRRAPVIEETVATVIDQPEAVASVLTMLTDAKILSQKQHDNTVLYELGHDWLALYVWQQRISREHREAEARARQEEQAKAARLREQEQRAALHRQNGMFRLFLATSVVLMIVGGWGWTRAWRQLVVNRAAVQLAALTPNQYPRDLQSLSGTAGKLLQPARYLEQALLLGADRRELLKQAGGQYATFRMISRPLPTANNQAVASSKNGYRSLVLSPSGESAFASSASADTGKDKGTMQWTPDPPTESSGLCIWPPAAPEDSLWQELLLVDGSRRFGANLQPRWLAMQSDGQTLSWFAPADPSRDCEQQVGPPQQTHSWTPASPEQPSIGKPLALALVGQSQHLEVAIASVDGTVWRCALEDDHCTADKLGDTVRALSVATIATGGHSWAIERNEFPKPSGTTHLNKHRPAEFRPDATVPKSLWLVTDAPATPDFPTGRIDLCAGLLASDCPRDRMPQATALALDQDMLAVGLSNGCVFMRDRANPSKRPTQLAAPGIVCLAGIPVDELVIRPDGQGIVAGFEHGQVMTATPCTHQDDPTHPVWCTTLVGQHTRRIEGLALSKEGAEVWSSSTDGVLSRWHLSGETSAPAPWKLGAVSGLGLDVRIKLWRAKDVDDGQRHLMVAEDALWLVNRSASGADGGLALLESGMADATRWLNYEESGRMAELSGEVRNYCRQDPLPYWACVLDGAVVVLNDTPGVGDDAPFARVAAAYKDGLAVWEIDEAGRSLGVIDRLEGPLAINNTVPPPPPGVPGAPATDPAEPQTDDRSPLFEDAAAGSVVTAAPERKRFASQPTSVEWHEDGNLLLTAWSDGAVKVYDLESGKLTELAVPAVSASSGASLQARAVAWAPPNPDSTAPAFAVAFNDGRVCGWWSSSKDDSVSRWDSPICPSRNADGRIVRGLHNHRVNSIHFGKAWSKNGVSGAKPTQSPKLLPLLVTGSADNTARVWTWSRVQWQDADPASETGRGLYSRALVEESARVRDAQLYRLEHQTVLVTAGSDRSVQIWELQPDLPPSLVGELQIGMTDGRGGSRWPVMSAYLSASTLDDGLLLVAADQAGALAQVRWGADPDELAEQIDKWLADLMKPPPPREQSEYSGLLEFGPVKSTLGSAQFIGGTK